MELIKTVLLIDDSDSINSMHQSLLSKFSFAEEIVTKNSASSAIEYLKHGDDGTPPRPELIFLDIEMPEENGFAFLEKYKELDEGTIDFKKTVIVILSNYITPENFTKGKEYRLLGVETLIRKPIDEYDLEELLLEHFKIDLNLS